MSRFLPLLALITAGLLAACSQSTLPTTQPVSSEPSTSAPTATAPSTPSTALGLVEISFNGVGTSNMLTSASVHLTAQAFSDVSAGLQLQYASNGFSDISGMRYAWATFKIRNADRTGRPYASALRNVTFLAASVNANGYQTVGDTPMSNLRRFDGSTYAEPLNTTLARSFVPTQKLDTTGSLSVVENGADLVLPPESSVADGQFLSGSSAVSYAGLGVTSILPYGFVARNLSGTTPAGLRTLPALTNDPRAVADQYDGLVTFALRVPLQANPADNPYSFSLVFETATDPVTRVSQSVEEQTSNGNTVVAARAASVGAAEVDILPNSTYPVPTAGQPGVTLLPNVRTAGSASAPTGQLLSAAALSKPGTFDRTFWGDGTSAGPLWAP